MVYFCNRKTKDSVVVQQMDAACIGELEKAKVNRMHAWAGWI